MKTPDINRNRLLLIGTLGVVYGDIGTSPLYALRECFGSSHSIAPTPENVLGIISLILWSLILVVSIKYLGLVMRADNKGEGGILALLSLAAPEDAAGDRRPIRFLILLGVFGAALMYGDGMITPALTVLGAVEGLEVLTPFFKPYVVPIAFAVLIVLFRVQRHGTGSVGIVFGPVMLVWFLVLGLLGLRGIWMEPHILAAVSPHHALRFLVANGTVAFVVLGAVFLAVTGAEALYADMGHFGIRPIRKAWFMIVFPGLILNYFGEGALLLVKPSAIQNPFFQLAPAWAVLPMVILSTMAAVIASQALITGAFSLTMQAIQMGFLPRLQIQHTSHAERGQIYMPQVNTFLMLACLGLVVGFQSSSRLAGAYGIAVSLTMLTTTILLYYVARYLWKWDLVRTALVCGFFVVLELLFVTANMLKLWQGGWFPLAVGAGIFVLMTTWKKGRHRLRAKLCQSYLPLESFLEDLKQHTLTRVPGTAVFLSGNPSGTPLALLHSLKLFKALHERVIILTIQTRDVPFVPEPDRIQVTNVLPDLCQISGFYGFMEQPNIPAILKSETLKDLNINPMQVTFFLSRETVIPKRGPGMVFWRRKLFAAMSRNAQSATAFFQLPANRVVELGMQVEI